MDKHYFHCFYEYLEHPVIKKGCSANGWVNHFTIFT